MRISALKEENDGTKTKPTSLFSRLKVELEDRKKGKNKRGKKGKPERS